MDYHFTITTSANVPKSSKVETEVELVAGTITFVRIYHPAGCAGLAHAAIRQGRHQLYPTNPEGSYHGDGIPDDFEDNYNLKKPAKLVIDTWNLDDTYEHSVQVRITILHRDEDVQISRLDQLLDLFRKLVGVSG